MTEANLKGVWVGFFGGFLASAILLMLWMSTMTTKDLVQLTPSINQAIIIAGKSPSEAEMALFDRMKDSNGRYRRLRDAWSENQGEIKDFCLDMLAKMLSADFTHGKTSVISENMASILTILRDANSEFSQRKKKAREILSYLQLNGLAAGEKLE